MIEEQAKVVSVDQRQVLVSAKRNSACGQCAAKEGCGQSAIAEWAASKMVDVSVNNPLQLSINVGDSVIVGINEQSFLKVSLLLYFVPLMVMFMAGAITTMAAASEGVIILSSMTALLGCFYVIKRYISKVADSDAYQLVVLEVL